MSNISYVVVEKVYAHTDTIQTPLGVFIGPTAKQDAEDALEQHIENCFPSDATKYVTQAEVPDEDAGDYVYYSPDDLFEIMAFDVNQLNTGLSKFK